MVTTVDSIAVDTSGNAYITGFTGSLNFPTTPGAFQTTFGGHEADAFISKLNADGSSLLYSTYMGGNDGDYGNGIAVDATGNAYVTGVTYSSNFPTTPGAFQTTCGGGQFGPCGDAFITKLNATGSALLYSTYLGGPNFDQGSGIAIDSSGSAYIAGGAGAGFPITPGAFQTTFGGFAGFSPTLGDALAQVVEQCPFKRLLQNAPTADQPLTGRIPS
jgi:hypothetical protein